MPNQNARRKTSPQINTWVVLVFFIVFIASLGVILLFVIQYSKTNLPPALTVVPATPTVAATLTLAPMPSETLVAPSPTPQTYIVKPGDTLSGIATSFGVTVDAIKIANALTSDIIDIDQPLLIPNGQLVLTSPVTTPVDTPLANTNSRYQVLTGDTLAGIASSRGLAVSDLRAANAMIGDTLIAGQFITIPESVPVALPPWKFSSLTGDFNLGYPLKQSAERFMLHYQPNTFPAQDPNSLIQMEANALGYLESLTNLRLASHYDVYAAGSNFESPNQALRGITYSSALKTFFLHNGTGNADDQQYIATHELTHLFFWNTIGSPSSTMLSEGTAVYTGMEMINASSHMPIETFCAAYLQAGVLPNVSGSPSFLGHIYDLQNYYAAGCFVKYLVNTYGIDSLKAVYHSGDYAGVYGKSLTTLESEWRVYLVTVSISPDLNPTELVGAVRDLETNYESFFSNFSGSPAQLDAYRELDNARIALLQGRFTEMHTFLDAFKSLR